MHLKKIKASTSEVIRLAYFYQNILELNVMAQSPGELLVHCGETELLFCEADGDQHPYYHFAFNIPSNQFGTAFRWLQNKTKLTWLEEYNGFVAEFINWHARSVYFNDPAGNILELICRRDLMDHAKEAFSSSQIRCISEIGIVLPAKDFVKSADSFRDKFGLSHFDKQPPLPHFQALGDDEGLFILVPEERVWFGSARQSVIFDIQVEFENNGQFFNYSSTDAF
jgi:catechol-2,3-dioxygenase